MYIYIYIYRPGEDDPKGLHSVAACYINYLSYVAVVRELRGMSSRALVFFDGRRPVFSGRRVRKPDLK